MSQLARTALVGCIMPNNTRCGTAHTPSTEGCTSAERAVTVSCEWHSLSVHGNDISDAMEGNAPLHQRSLPNLVFSCFLALASACASNQQKGVACQWPRRNACSHKKLMSSEAATFVSRQHSTNLLLLELLVRNACSCSWVD